MNFNWNFNSGTEVHTTTVYIANRPIELLDPVQTKYDQFSDLLHLIALTRGVQWLIVTEPHGNMDPD